MGTINTSIDSGDISSNEVFDVYYIEYDEEHEEYNTIVKKAIKPIEDTLYLIGQDLMYLNDFDISNFNFLIFEDDIEKLSDAEFEYFWEKFFKTWIQKINEDYLEIDLEMFFFQLSNTQERKYLIKKIVHFIMMFMPYNIVKNVLNNYIDDNENSSGNLQNIVNEFSEYPGFIRDMLLKEIDENINKIKNLYNSLDSMTSLAKKNAMDDSLELLHSQLNKQIDYLDIFKEIIKNADEENLKNLILIYIDKDPDNIVD